MAARAADGRRHEVACREAAGVLDHFAEELVAEDEVALARRWLTVKAFGDLPVRAADAHLYGAYADAVGQRRRVVDRFHARGVHPARRGQQCLHRVLLGQTVLA